MYDSIQISTLPASILPNWNNTLYRKHLAKRIINARFNKYSAKISHNTVFIQFPAKSSHNAVFIQQLVKNPLNPICLVLYYSIVCCIRMFMFCYILGCSVLSFKDGWCRWSISTDSGSNEYFPDWGI